MQLSVVLGNTLSLLFGNCTHIFFLTSGAIFFVQLKKQSNKESIKTFNEIAIFEELRACFCG